ncbi:MAG: Flp pilus assembly complex ATPase component TadA [Gemmatimonadaceae bacterium]|nr:Flp pilus assembly complex ATPase component TadA [Gemmatimonadaceae bacterium]
MPMKVDRLHLVLGLLLALGVGFRAVSNHAGRQATEAPELREHRARLDSARLDDRKRSRKRAKVAGTPPADSVAGPRRERTPAGALDPGSVRAPTATRAAPDDQRSTVRVDVNMAGVPELVALPGVGPSLARRIVEHRQAHGPYATLQALGEVKGLGPRLLARLAPHVTFGRSMRPSRVSSGTPVAASPVSHTSLNGARRALPASPRAAFSVLAPTSDSHMAAPPVAAPEKLADALLRDGLITREQYERARQEAKQGSTSFAYALVKLGLLPEVELTKYVARGSRMPAVDLTKFEVDPRIIKLVPAEQAIKHLVLPLKRDGRTLTVAVADPTNLGILEDLKFITRYDIFPVLAGEFTLRNVIDKQYDQGDQNMKSLLDDINLEGDVEVVEEQEEDVSAAALAAAVDDAPVVKLINAILTDAVKRGASDIHFECFEHELRVRYRIDGALQEVMKPPLKLKAALISRFKIMAQLNIAERRVPQDGRIKLKIGNKVIDYRVSTLPTLFGEKVVLRILDKGNLTLDLEKFGIEPSAEQSLMEAIMNPYGMVLVTGPTGSGKTTTLYSALSKINNIDVNIMTAEDPVEYNLFGINQVQVRNEIGMTFAAALKAFLRQDPNIIMVGEIRDLETGGIAIKAALTGHLVLSTLHTNSAPETVTRLLDMGLEPFNVASALNLILAQRLVRRICPRCKKKYTPDETELAGAKVSVDTTLRELRFTERAVVDAKARATAEAAPHLEHLSLDTRIGDLPFFKGRGCEECAGTGLRGRQGLYEVMFMTPELRKLILMNVGAQEVKDAAIEQGMLTLRMDGWLKVLKGVTTLEQVIRETSV